MSATTDLRNAADHIEAIGYTGSVTFNAGVGLHVEDRPELDRLLALHRDAKRHTSPKTGLAWWTADVGGLTVILYESFARADGSGVAS